MQTNQGGSEPARESAGSAAKSVTDVPHSRAGSLPHWSRNVAKPTVLFTELSALCRPSCHSAKNEISAARPPHKLCMRQRPHGQGAIAWSEENLNVHT
ncbi:hypothetical protein EVS84_11695 [Pseudomonas koreensis]|uniref:Uncharacterized protein n=1 Tax=Pseudomonas koreensis TaxID=198620 RepID=A0A4V1WHQ9_9PSED|nr:hypothetical protein EVS84_11695 [Pseudomonas koreensis]